MEHCRQFIGGFGISHSSEMGCFLGRIVLIWVFGHLVIAQALEDDLKAGQMLRFLHDESLTNMTNYHRREKRSAWSAACTSCILMTKPSSSNTFYWGDQSTFSIHVLLPKIDESKKSKIHVQLQTGYSSNCYFMGICDFKIAEIKSNVKTSGEHTVKYSESRYSHGECKTLYYQADLELPDVFVTSENLRKIVFDAKAVGLHYSSSSVKFNVTSIVSISNYSVHFSDVFKLYTGRSSSRDTHLSSSSYQFEHKNSKANSKMKLNEIQIVKRMFYNTYPSLFNLYMNASELLGKKNAFHFGQPVFDVPAASRCNQRKVKVETNQLLSDGGTSVGRMLAKYPGSTLNLGTNRNRFREENVVTVKYPVKALTPGTFYASFTVHSFSRSTSKIEISDSPMSYSTQDVSSEMKLIPYPVYPGAVATFQITYLVGPAAGAQLVITAAGDDNASPVGATIRSLGVCLPIASELLVAGQHSENEIQDGKLKMKFPNIYNADDQVSSVTIDIFYKIKEDSCTQCSATVSIALLGSQTFSSNIPITRPPSKKLVKDLKVQEVEIGWSGSFNHKWSTGKGIKFTLPDDMSSSNGQLKVFPNFVKTDKFDIKLCRMDIKRIGSNLPCIATSKKANYSKSSVLGKYQDSASIDLGGSCPVYRSPEESENSFLMRIIYQLPYQENMTSTVNLDIGAGLYLQDKLISTVSYTLKPPSETLSSGSYHLTSISRVTDQIVRIHNPHDTFYEKETITAGGIFMVRIVNKVQPGQRGLYKFSVFHESVDLAVCALKVPHIGENFPCLDKPEGYQDDEPPVNIKYNGSRYKFGKEKSHLVSVRITSWRDSPDKGTGAVNDLYSDDDTIEINAFVKVSETILTDEASISAKWHKFQLSASSFSSASYSFKIGQNQNETKVESFELNSKFISVVSGDSLTSFHKFIPKIVGLLLTYPKGLKNKILVKIINTNFDAKKYIDLCSLIITRKGNNIPCLKDDEPFQLSNKDEADFVVDDSGRTHYRYISLELDVYAQYDYSDHIEDSQVLLELTFRSNEETSSTVSLKAEIAVLMKKENQTTILEQKFLQADMPVNLVSLEPPIIRETKGTINGAPGQKVWMPIDIYIPRGKIIPLTVAFLTPSNCGKAMLTVGAVRFGNSGANICCASREIDLDHVYGLKTSKTGNVTTFMQTDLAMVDLGFVQNGGATFRRGLNRYEHDLLQLEAEIMASDFDTEDEKEFDIYIAIATEELVSVTNSTFKVKRVADREDYERPNIILNMTAFNVAKPFMNGDKIWAFGSIFHMPNSRGEAPEDGKTYIRFIFPPWIEYNLQTDVCKTNQTAPDLTPGFCAGKECCSASTTTSAPSAAASSLLQATALSGSFNPSHTNPYTGEDTFTENCDIRVASDDPLAIELYLNQGVLFQDYIGIYFSLTVDPRLKIRVGSGILKSMVVSVVNCDPTPYQNWPDSSDYPVTCGVYEGFLIHVTAPECFDDILVSECGVSANTALDSDHQPKNVLNAADTAWSPAIRLGSGWNDHLRFDFRTNTRITLVKIVLKTKSKKPSKISIQVSNSDVSWLTVVTKDFPANGEVLISPAQETRYARIVIDEYEEDKSNELAAAFRQVTWIGCFVPKVSSNFPCKEDTTKISTELSQYRHVAYDAFNELFYFCDVNPKIEGLKCYGNIAGTNKFIELASSVAYIAGYSAMRGKMFFIDSNGNLVSSTDGKSMTSHLGLKIKDITDLSPSTVIPGKGQNMPSVIIEDYVVDFHGIEFKGKQILSWSPCCKQP